MRAAPACSSRRILPAAPGESPTFPRNGRRPAHQQRLQDALRCHGFDERRHLRLIEFPARLKPAVMQPIDRQPAQARLGIIRRRPLLTQQRRKPAPETAPATGAFLRAVVHGRRPPSPMLFSRRSISLAKWT